MAKNTNKFNTDEKQENKNKPERKIILLMGMGLNGIDAGGWALTADLIKELWILLESIDTFILGRVTFEMWEGYWPLQAKKPSSNDFQKRFSVFVDQIQKIVISTTLKSVKWQNSRVINDNISTEISRLKNLPGKNIALVGGPGIAQTFTKLNLIDEYQLYIDPVIYGPGKSVLGILDSKRQLEIIDTHISLPDGIRLHLRPVK